MPDPSVYSHGHQPPPRPPTALQLPNWGEVCKCMQVIVTFMDTSPPLLPDSIMYFMYSCCIETRAW